MKRNEEKKSPADRCGGASGGDKSLTYRVFLRGLALDVVVGVLPEERLAPRRIILEVEAVCAAPADPAADDIRTVVDYRLIRQAAADAAAGTACQLVETLAARIADAIVAVPGVREAAVTLDKPGALEACESVAVQIVRRRAE